MIIIKIPINKINAKLNRDKKFIRYTNTII